MTDYIVIRPAPGTPKGWVPAKYEGRWVTKRMDLTPVNPLVRASYKLTEYAPTGWYEYRDDGERAEVCEAGPPEAQRHPVELLDAGEVLEPELWERFGADVRRRLAAGLEAEAHGHGYRLERPVAYQVREETVLGTPMVSVRAMASVCHERLTAEGGEG